MDSSIKNSSVNQNHVKFRKLCEISALLCTGLNSTQLHLCQELIRKGVNPEALAHTILTIREELQESRRSDSRCPQDTYFVIPLSSSLSMENVDPEYEGPIRGRGRPLGARTMVKSVNLKKVAEIDQKKINHLQCNVCNMQFGHIVRFANHCLRNHFNALFYQYDCGFCFEVHGSREEFLKHLVSQRVDKNFNTVSIVCPLCVLPQGTSSSEEQFYDHLHRYHFDPRNEKWVCTLPACVYVVRDLKDYAKHIIDVHTDQIVPNSICELCRNRKCDMGMGSACNEFKLNLFAEDYESDAEETCPLCFCVLKDLNTILVSDKDVISFEKPKYYRCSVCNSGFSTQTKMTKHACRQLRTTQCSQCGQQFTSKKRLVFHLQSHIDSAMTLRCDVCMLTFADETACYDHVRFSHESETLCCDTCGKTYITRIGLSMHQMYHDDVRKFKCSECGKKFLNQATLKEHQVSHLIVKPFQCDICGKSLSRASRLRIHLKVHSARSSTNFQKCFACKICGYVAYSRERLIEHAVKIHNSSDSDAKQSILHKLYRCEFCDACYEMPSLLHVHRESHQPESSENPFSCGLCNGIFKTYSRLVTHKLSHGINTESLILQTSSNLENPDRFIIPQYFCCKFCDKIYEQYTAYNIHMKHSKHLVPKEKSTSIVSSGKENKKQRGTPSRSKNVPKKDSFSVLKERQPLSSNSWNQQLKEKQICYKCGKHFPTVEKLKAHENRHNPKRSSKSFDCEECGVSFASKMKLHQHKNAYHRPYMACENCGKEFRCKGWYEQHVKNRICWKEEGENEQEVFMNDEENDAEDDPMNTEEESMNNEDELQDELLNDVPQMEDAKKEDIVKPDEEIPLHNDMGDGDLHDFIPTVYSDILNRFLLF